MNRLTHHGEPMPLPRPKVRIMPGRDGSHWPKFYLPSKARTRMDELASEWQRLGLPCMTGPLVCEATFACSRPLAHLGTGANAGVVKPRYLDERPKGGDVDNCAKLILDALEGHAFANDDQVVRLVAEKLYADQAGLTEPQSIVELRPLVEVSPGALFAVEAPSGAGPYDVEAA